jgi:hypothetical protein
MLTSLGITDVYPQQYGGRVLRIPKEPPYIPTSLGIQVSLTFRGKVNEVNEGKFVLNIDFIMALKPDGLCVYETTKQDSI